MTLAGATRHFMKDESVFAEGDHGDCAYIVEKGMVEISTTRDGRRSVLCLMGPGMLFGEMAILDDVVRSADARATEESHLVVVTRETVRSRLEEADPITRLLLRVILERFRREIRIFRPSTPPPPGVEQPSMRADVFQHDAVEKMKLEGELRTAMDEGQLELHFQPLVRLKDRRMTGFEALVRWRHPEKGLVSPGLFVPLAEETALIIPMGKWVLEEACRWMTRFREVLPETVVAVNISGRQFAEPGFLEGVEKICADHGVAHDQLKLEITEGILMDYPAAPTWMEQCKAHGFKMSLDDFGTGYSSLSYLHKFPTDQLKVDRSFVQTMGSNPRSMEVVRAVVGLAHGLGMELVAEGVEKAEELAILMQLGCEYGQGYHFSKPVPGVAALELLRKGTL